MERIITGMSARRPVPATGVTLKVNPLTRAAAAAEVRQLRHGRETVHVRNIPELRMATGAVLVACDSSHTRRRGRTSPRKSRFLKQATSASISPSRSHQPPAQTELELIKGLCEGQGISEAVLDFQKQSESQLQCLKISIELCKKEYFVVPKAMAESDLKFYDEEDERVGRKVWFQLVSVEVDPGERRAYEDMFL